MSKKILFPATFRGHLARQQLLIEELKRYFEVDVWIPKEEKDGMAVNSIFYAIQLHNYLNGKKFDYAMIRGDRYEILPIAVICVYRGIPLIHIEGGDLSGTIDNKIRYVITHLADYHFVTNEESHRRLIQNGIPIGRVWDFGSLDVEFAKSVSSNLPQGKKYMVVSFHPIEGEDEDEVEKACQNFTEYAMIRIASNKDYGSQYGAENYSPEDYINLLRHASCLVGNSSSFLKEASIMGTPVVNVGERQQKRLKPQNIIDVPCEEKRIKKAIRYQLEVGKYNPSFVYYQKNTSKKIAAKLREIL